MLILGRDDAGRVVTVGGLNDIDQIDWMLSAEGEYVYAFTLSDGETVVIREPGLGPAGRDAVAEAASDYDTQEGMDD